jgi:hypothetical protein
MLADFNAGDLYSLIIYTPEIVNFVHDFYEPEQDPAGGFFYSGYPSI